MRARFAAAAALTALLPAFGWSLALNPQVTLHPSPLDEVQNLFNERRFDQVTARLSDSELQKLHRQDLPRAYDLLGLSYEYEGDVAKSLGVYQLAAGLFPKDLQLLTHLAELLHHAELDDQAKPLYERVLSIHPNNAVANLGMAEIERATGFLTQSAASFERCLSEWKDNPTIWREYGEVLAESRNYPKAAAAIETALKLAPGDADTLYSLAQFQRAAEMKETAYKTLDSAIGAAVGTEKYSALRPRLSLQRALWLLQDGRLQESLAQAQEELSRDARDPLGLWIRASVSIREGRIRQAQADLETAAAQEETAPFVAHAAADMLREIGSSK